MKRKPTPLTKPKQKKTTPTSISQHQLLHYTLTKQGLINRQPKTAIPTLGVLHSTNQTTPFLSLFARITHFDPVQFLHETVDEKNEKKKFYRIRCMRGTLHLVPRDLIFLLKIYESEFKWLEEAGVEKEEADRLLEKVVEVIRESGPQSSVMVKVYEGLDVRVTNRGVSKMLGSVILNYGMRIGRLVYGVDQPGCWKRDYRKFGVMSEGDAGEDVDVEVLMVRMADWYFTVYGPASFEDFVWWSGLAKTKVRKAFLSIKDKLSTVTVDDLSEDLYLMTDQLESLLNTEGNELEMVRFLPYEDAILKAYKSTRHRFYNFEPYEKSKHYFERRGEAMPTVWLNGKVIGQWSWSRKQNSPLTISLLPEHSTPDVQSLLSSEATNLASFLNASTITYTELTRK